MSGSSADRGKKSKANRRPTTELELRVNRLEELQRAYQALQAEAASLRQDAERSTWLLSSIMESYYILDHEWRIIEINENALDYFGKTRADLQGKLIWEIIPTPPDHPIFQQFVQSVQEGRPRHFEAHSSGVDRWAEFHVCPSPQGVTVFFTDITSRKRAEENLVYQANLLENIHDAIIATDLQHRITAWNLAAEELFGWKAGEVLGKPIAEVVRSDYDQDVYDRVLSETSDLRLEATLYTRSGRPVTVEMRNIALRDEHGKITGYASANRDVTFRRRAEEALRKSELNYRQAAETAQVNLDKLEAVISSMVEGVIIADPLGNILTMNPASRALHGFGEEEDVHHSVRELARQFTTVGLDGEPIHPTEWPIVRAAQGDLVTNFEMTVTRNDTGRTWTGLYNARPVHGKNGEVILIVVTIIDISERRRHSQDNRFLAQVGDALLRLETSAEITQAVAAMVGQYMQVDRCHLEEVDQQRRMVTILSGYVARGTIPTGVYAMDLFPPEQQRLLAAGNSVVVPDALLEESLKPFQETFAQVGTRSFLTVPWLQRGTWVADLTVASEQPRSWPPEDVRLLQAVADLTWMALEKARLREDLEISRTRFQLALTHSPITVYTNDLDLRYTWIYNPPNNLSPEAFIGKTDRDLMPPEDAKKVQDLKRQVLETGDLIHQELVLHSLDGQEQFFDMTLEPIRSGETITGLTVAAIEITERRKLEAEMRSSEIQLEIQRMILEYREQERLEIAQDLHDGPLQQIIALGYNLTEALEINAKDERMKKLADLYAQLQAMAQELRTFCSDLRPPALAPFGLQKAILSHLDTFKLAHPGLLCLPELMADNQELPEPMRLALYRIYQELLNNIVKHAEAKTVNIRLTLDEAQVELEIQDDGCGFSLPENWIELARQGHFGLVGILERAEALNGRVLIRTRLGEGTLVRVIIPRSQSADQYPINGTNNEEHDYDQ